MNKLNAFVKEFVAIIKGDDAEAKAAKSLETSRKCIQSTNCSSWWWFNPQGRCCYSSWRKLAKALVNGGNEINDRDAYIANLISAKESLKSAEKQLTAHKDTIAFLEEQYALLKAE